MNPQPSTSNPQKSAKRPPGAAAPVRSSRLRAAALWLAFLLTAISCLLTPTRAPAALIRFGPYTNSIGGDLLINTDIIVRTLGDPAIDAAGNVTGIIGLPKRITLGADGLATNVMQNQHYIVTNNPGTPAYFNKGYIFRAPLDSGPTVYSSTAPGILVSGMNYFVTLNGGTNGGVTLNALTNALGYLPLAPADTNGYIRLLQATNVANAFVFSASNSLYSDYTTRIAVVSALTISVSNSLYSDYTSQIAALAARSFTNAFATNAAGISYANGRVYISTNYDAPGAALAVQTIVNTRSNEWRNGSNNLNAAIASVGNGLVKILSGGSTNLTSTNQLTVYSSDNGTSTQVKVDVSDPFAGPVITYTSDDSLGNGTITEIFREVNDFNNAVITVGHSETGDTNTAYYRIDVPGAPSGHYFKLSTNGLESDLLKASGIFLSNLNASAISSGTLSPARLSFGTSNFLATVTPFAGLAVTYTTNSLGVVSATLVNGNVLTNGSTLDATKLSGLVPHGSLLSFILTNNWQGIITTKGLNVSGGFTNGQATANTLAKFDANKGEVSLANGSGALTNNGSGGFGYVTLIDLPTVTNVAQSVTVAATGITNVYGTNLPTVLVVGSRAYVPTNFDAAGGSNVLFALNTTSSNALASLNTASSNGLQAFKLSKTNDTSYSQVATNLATEGNLSFGFTGQATNILSTTNVTGFINAGSAQATNGAFVWNGSIYTNWVNAAILTNNGSAWLLQTNGVTLYSLSGTSPVGAYSAINGALPAPLGIYGFLFDHNRMVDVGFFSITNFNFVSNSIVTNVVISTTNNFIGNLNGKGTNTFLTNATLVWESIAAPSFRMWVGGRDNGFIASDLGAVLSGQTNSINYGTGCVIAGGVSNRMVLGGAPGFYSFIGGGFGNGITSGLNSSILGGVGNAMGWGGEAMSILGGGHNIILAPNPGTTASGSVIVGGFYNSISSTSPGVGSAGLSSAILSGSSNSITSAFGVVMGKRVSLTNDNVLAWGDGVSFSPPTNNQVAFAATNGLAVYVGGISLTNLNPGAATMGLGVTAAGQLTTNSVPSSGQTAAQVATQIASTNNAIIQPSVNAKLAVTNSFVKVISGGATNFTSTNILFVATSGSSGGETTSMTADTSDETAGPVLIFRADDSQGAGTSTIIFREVNDFDNAFITSGHTETGETNTAFFRVGLAPSTGNHFLILTTNGVTADKLTGYGSGLTNQSDLTVGNTNTLASRKEVVQIATGLGIGSGTVTSVALTAPSEFTVSGSPVTTSSTLAITRTADANFLGLGATNMSFLKVTNTASIGGQVTMSALVLTNGFTNQALTASTLLWADANKKVASIANPTVASVLTNLNGTIGYAPLLDASALGASAHLKTGATTNLISSEDATGYTNTVSWTHEGTATNITAAFNGTLQSYTITNGPDVFFGYAGANGSVSYRYSGASFATLHFSYQPKWISGSNNVITNGVLSLTSYGGTNAAQLEAALKENQ